MSKRLKPGETREFVVYNEIGEKITVIDDSVERMVFKERNPSDYIFRGEQYCPYCHKRLDYEPPVYNEDGGYEGGGIWYCEDDDYCIGISKITEDDPGYPSLASTYEHDYAGYEPMFFDDDDDDDDEDEEDYDEFTGFILRTNE